MTFREAEQHGLELCVLRGAADFAVRRVETAPSSAPVYTVTALPTTPPSRRYCAGKQAFRTHADARDALERLRGRADTRDAELLAVHVCAVCGPPSVYHIRRTVHVDQQRRVE